MTDIRTQIVINATHAFILYIKLLSTNKIFSSVKHPKLVVVGKGKLEGKSFQKYHTNITT